MAIIFMDGDETKRIEESNFRYEDKLQEYVAKNPEIVPVYDIDEDTRLLITAREFKTSSGPIDALGFDNNGNIYIIETKLYKNPEGRRTIIAQTLDYGASLWRSSNNFTDFMISLDDASRKNFNKSFEEKYAEFFKLDDATEQLQQIESNLSEGIIKFVVLVDKLHDSVKNLAMFVNQNSKFDLYLVELEYYQHDKFEVIIPKLFGAEVKKDVPNQARRITRRWNKESFFEAVDNSELVSETQRKAVHKFWEWSESHGATYNWGTARVYGTFSPVFDGLTIDGRSLFSSSIDSYVGIHYEYLLSHEDRLALRDMLKKHLADAAPKVTDITDDNIDNKHPSISAKVVPDIVDNIIAAFDEFVQLKKGSSND